MIDREELNRLRTAAAAYPFVDENWEGSYTRETGIKSIRYQRGHDNYRPYWPIKSNLGFLFSEILPWRKEDWERQLSKKPWWLPRPVSALRWLTFTSPDRPDGALNSGCIVTYWEEAGQFIENFPPSKVLELIELAEAGLAAAAKHKYDQEQAEKSEADRS